MANKRKGQRLTDKQLIALGLGVTLISFVGFGLFIFRDKIFQEKPENVDWGEISEEGDIFIDENAQEKEIPTFTDSCGQSYTQKNLYNIGISLFFPDDWKINCETTDTIYITSDKKGYEGVEICLTAKGITNANPSNIQDAMYYFMRDNFTYHTVAGDVKILSYKTNVEGTQDLRDNSKDVYISQDPTAEYIEYDSLDDAPVGNYNKTKKFIGLHENTQFTMTSGDGSLEADPYCDIFYTFRGNTIYLMSVTYPAHTDSVLVKAHDLFETISNSIQQVTPSEEIALPSFNKTEKVGNVTFKYPDTWESKFKSYGRRFEATNINKDDFGVGISAYTIDFSSVGEPSFDLTQNLAYKRYLLCTLAEENVLDLSGDYVYDYYMSINNAENITINDVTCEVSDICIDMLFSGTELETKVNRCMPIYGKMFKIPDGKYMQVITITYGKGNEAIAEKYANALKRTISVNN